MVIQVCIGSACHLKGSYEVIQTLKGLISTQGLEKKVTLQSSFCLGICGKSVSIKVDDQVLSLKPDEVVDFFEKNVLEVING